MSETEDFDTLKVTELQNELKKRGLDTKGRKADLVDRLRQADINGTEADGTTGNLSEPNDLIKDETSSPSNTAENEETQSQTIEEAKEADTEEKDDSPLSKKRPLTDEDEKGEDNEENATEAQSREVENDDETNPSDDLSQQKRKKKSRWATEPDDESSEKQSNARQSSESDDNDDDDRHTIDDNSSSRHRERDYRSSRQHDDDRHYSSRHSEKSAEREIPLPEEELVQFNNEDVVLDFYTSDLNLAINNDCLSASTKSNDALCFIWAGVRATYGFQQGKICYEIRITEILECPQMPDEEEEKYGLRFGWSNLSSGLQALQLGEFNDSFAYTSNGKKMSKVKNETTEEAYGETLTISDVLAAYIDFDEEFIRISFAKNGQDCGQAFEIAKGDFKEFYPHILVKNMKFECNFGQLENSWAEIKADYVFAQAVPLAERTRSSEPIAEKNQCEVILLSGLNGSGKTTWAKKFIEENSSKNYNLLNAEHVLDKMAVDGKLPPIKDRNDGLMLRVNVCLQKLIESAAQRRRNYIIDHVNTTRESQVKRQRLFTGYHRVGVVIIPEDEEYKRRLEKLERNENISMPSQWIRDAKSRFHFPQKSSSLEDVLYPELNYDDGKGLYDRVRRDSDQHRSSSRYDRHDDYHSSRNNNRNRYEDRDRRSRERDRYARSRSRERDRDRDRRTSSRDDSRFSSSHRNDNFRGGGYSRGGGIGGGGPRYSDHRQDSRNPRGGFHDSGNGGSQYRGRGGYNNQGMDDRRGGGGYQQQRNDFGGRGRGGFDSNRNQFNPRGSYQDNQRSGGFRQDSNSQQRGRFNDYDRNQSQQQQRGGRGFMHNNGSNNNNFNQQQDRQGYGSRPPMQQQQPYQNQPQQHRPQPLLQNPPSNQQQQQPPPQQQQQQQQFPAHMLQQAMTNPNLALQSQNQLGINPLASAANVAQQSSLEPWLALCAAALNPQASAVQQQPQQDANNLAQWTQWLKSAQMAQTAQQTQPQLAVHQSDPQQQQQQQQAQLADASALYYQAYYAQLAAAQQQAAAHAAASGAGNNTGVAPPGSGNK